MSCSSDDENENGGNTANSDFILNIDGTDYPMWVNGVELDEDYFVFLLYSNKTGIDPDIVLSYYGVISDYNVPTSVANESQLFFYDEFMNIIRVVHPLNKIKVIALSKLNIMENGNKPMVIKLLPLTGQCQLNIN